jgi:benzoyl-CoA reductase/2-hydroxyglutaryl-CoA dehydratase subunit BcrC/BadD/HgdB
MARPNRQSGARRNIPTFERILRVIHQVQARAFEREGQARSLLFREIARQALAAFEREAPVVWTSAYAFPMEFINGLGLLPVDFEIYAGLLSSANQSPHLLEAADSIGLPQDTCTIHRIAVGAASLEQLPKPDLLVSTTHYCDGKAKTNEIMASLYGVDYLLLDMPLERTPQAKAYLEKQLWALFERLCAIAGKPVDEGILAAPVERFNEMTRVLKRINILRKGRPSPLLPNNGGFIFSFMAALLYGTHKAVEIYGTLERNLLQQISSGQTPPERLRFLWLMASPTFSSSLFQFIEERGGRIVMEELSHCYWDELDPSRPISSIADRMLYNHFLGPIERRVRTAIELAMEYEVDAVLNFVHLPCRQSGGALEVLREGLEGRGFRFINIEGDLGDPANFPEDKIIKQLTTYWEILEGGRKREDILTH